MVCQVIPGLDGSIYVLGGGAEATAQLRETEHTVQDLVAAPTILGSGGVLLGSKASKVRSGIAELRRICAPSGAPCRAVSSRAPSLMRQVFALNPQTGEPLHVTGAPREPNRCTPQHDASMRHSDVLPHTADADHPDGAACVPPACELPPLSKEEVRPASLELAISCSPTPSLLARRLTVRIWLQVGRLLISRSDYSARVVDPDSGRQRWNVSVAQLALELLPAARAAAADEEEAPEHCRAY